MKISDLYPNGNVKIISKPQTPIAGNNNPLNVKMGTATAPFVASGDASVSSPAQDGGNFLKFNATSTAMKDSSKLLFSNPAYTSLTVDQAMKQWSGGGYDGSIAPTLKGRTISSLNPNEQQTLMTLMASKGEGSQKPMTLSQLYPNGNPKLVQPKPKAPTPPPQKLFSAAMGNPKQNNLIDTAKNTGQVYSDSAQKIGSSYSQAEQIIKNPKATPIQKVSAGLEGGLGMASGFASSLFAPLTGTLKTVSDNMANNPAVQAFAQNPTVGKALDSLQKPLSDLQKEHPEFAKNVGDVLNVFTNMLGLAGVGSSEVTNTLSDALKTSQPDVVGQTSAVEPNPKIADMISPKLNAKEVKLAISDGRISSGDDPTLLKGGTEDSIIPSAKIAQVTQTIEKSIPNAENMKPPELFKALNDNGVSLRDKLTPIMEKTPIKPEDIQKINDDWTALKAKQNSDIYMSNQVDLQKMQTNFEENFLKKTGNENMNDLWKTTQSYDASVPARVKNATSLSTDLLQSQKEIWLQNRSILTDITHKVSTGLDETSAKMFSDMSDMYTAKENILSKAKLQGVRPSLIAQWVKDNPWKSSAIGIGIGAATGANKVIGAGIKMLTGL